MRDRKLTMMYGCLVSLLVILLIACACAAADVAEESPGEAAISYTREEAGERVEEAEVPGQAAAPEEVEEPAAEEPAQEADVGITRALQAPVPQTQRMVIKDAEMELLVDDTDIALAKITQVAADYGGYIISSQSFFRDEIKFATIRIGVPAGNFETVMNNLRNVGIRVIKEEATGKDVTAEYVDLESRLENLEATAARVRSFLEAADTVEEALQVNQELSKLEDEIEQVKGQMRFYEGRSAFSTITISLEPQLPTPTPTLVPTQTPTPTPTPTATPGPPWNPGETLQASADVLESLFKGVVDVLIWVIVIAGPFALVALIIFLIVRWLYKRSRMTTQTEAVSEEVDE